MQISAIQGQVTNSQKGLQSKKTSYSDSAVKDSALDNFAQNATNNLSFKAAEVPPTTGEKIAIGAAKVVFAPILLFAYAWTKIGEIFGGDDDDGSGGGGLNLPPNV